MKASFFERLLAYVIDIIILSAILSIIVTFIPDSGVAALQTKLDSITNNYISDGMINLNAYIANVSSLYYQIDMKDILTSIIGIIISATYFMYYQFKNEGRTLGKKLMHIKIIKQEGKLELNDLVLRSLLIDNIACSTILILVLYISTKGNYFIIKASVEMLQFIFIAMATFMIMFRQDKRGIHDLICKTSVIKYGKEEK